MTLALVGLIVAQNQTEVQSEIAKDTHIRPRPYTLDKGQSQLGYSGRTRSNKGNDCEPNIRTRALILKNILNLLLFNESAYDLMY